MKVEEFASLLFDIESVSHVAHLQTKKFSDHMALNDLYDGIVDLRDRFIETYQGKYGIIKGYELESDPEIEIKVYLKETVGAIEKYREELKDGYLQQIVDDVIELIYGTLYKLNTLTQ